MPDENPGLEMIKSAGEGMGRESVNKLATFFGGFFPFFGQRKRAVDAYINDIEKSNMDPATKMFLIANTKKTFKEMRNQMAIAEVAQKVAKDGTDFSMNSGVDDEWLSRYMDAGRHVSDEEMQVLWGNILAGEFEDPGSTPPSVIRILSEITTKYAKIFANVCSLGIVIFPADASGTPVKELSRVLVSTKECRKYLNDLEINFTTLSELDKLGLIQFRSAGYVRRYDSNKRPIVHIYANQKVITCTKYPNRCFPTGEVLLTDAGESISRFIDKKTLDGFEDYVLKYYKSRSAVSLSEEPMVSITEASGEGTHKEYSYEILHKEPPRKSEQQ